MANSKKEITSSRIGKKRVHLDPEKKGYWHEGVFREGFEDDPDLSTGDKRLILVVST